MRSTAAANSAKATQDALTTARQNELDALRGASSGLTKDQIAEKQYQLAQQVYALENNPTRLQMQQQILNYQDQIYKLEQDKLAAEDAIKKIQDTSLKALVDQQTVLNNQLLSYQLQSDQLFAQIDYNDKNRQIMGYTRADWDRILAAVTSADETLSNSMAQALALAKDASDKIASDWESIKKNYDAIQSKAITITQQIVTIGAGTPLPEPPPVVDTYSAPIVTPTTSYSAPVDYSGFALPTTTPGVSGSASQFGSSTPWAMAVGNFMSTPTTSVNTSQGVLNKLNSMGILSSGGLVATKYFANGGYAMGTDKVPALLTPGEFVMSRYAVNNHGIDKMKAMNNGSYDGSAVYNYSVNVNVDGTNSDADEIAKVVIKQIRQLEGQRIRTQII
jgi:hypothetical protein